MPDAAPDTVQLRPVIDELVRNQLCAAKLTLLVDRIAIVQRGAPHDSAASEQAFRVWLTDGHKSIQGILKYELHPYVVAGHVVEGSYVEITSYTISAAKRVIKDSHVFVLHAKALQAIGHDGRERHPAGPAPTLPSSSLIAPHLDVRLRRTQSPVANQQELEVLAQADAKSLSALHDDSLDADKISESDIISLVPVHRPRGRTQKNAGKEKMPEPPREKRKREVTSSPLESITLNPATRPGKIQKNETRSKRGGRGTAPPPLEDITRPLKITPLARLIGPRTIRNRIHDVLAIICAVDGQVIRRKGMPEQRNLRITDQSTTKLVQLTVFVDAIHFRPAVGTVALFRNVTTHEWNGGSLKAYPRDCAGMRWYFPEPVNIDAKQLSLLRHCWKSRRLSNADLMSKNPRPPD